MKIGKITVENMQHGCVTDEKNPMVSFSLTSETPNSWLKSAMVTIADDVQVVNKQTDIVYNGSGLHPFTDYHVNVQACDNYGDIAESSTEFRTGRLDMPWQAKWISGVAFKKKKVSPVPQTFRKNIRLNKPLSRAEICCTAMGLFKLYVDGAPVGEDYFAPGFTSYNKNLQYMYYDVTTLLHDNSQLIFVVAGGWAVGSYTHARRNRIYADRQMLMCELRLTYKDGSVEIVSTDGSWEVSEDGNFRSADLYDGEVYDANVDLDRIAWQKACVRKLKFTPQISTLYGVPVRAHETMVPISCNTLDDGTLLYDFGQNFAGVIDAKLNCIRGQKVIFRHAEILQNGRIFTEPLRSAKQTAIYIAKDGVQQYSPTFSYMGFRYVEVSGIRKQDIVLQARALYSDLPSIGSFSCSDQRINQLHSNIVWSAKSNFVDIPTDCPQRDERMGWTGDIAMFAPTACFNFDMSRFFDKWLADVVAEQKRSGAVPVVVPHVSISGNFETTFTFPIDFWGDACVLVPWAEYLSRGNTRILRRCYPTMKKYINACRRLAAAFSIGKKRYVWDFHHYGDWCAPDGNWKEWMSRGKWTATACLYNSSKIVANIAGILGFEKDQQFFQQLAEKVAYAYVNVFTDGNGKLKQEFQAAYVLPIAFGMLDDRQRQLAVDNLTHLVRKDNYHIGTGFTATPHILFALADNGHVEDAFSMLMCDDCPSWLYQVKCGATSIWERWDALKENGEFNNKDTDDVMVSFNHYANGSVGAFLYRRIVGLEATKAGYKCFTVKPVLGGGLTWAKCTLGTPYGQICVKWVLENGTFCLSVDVPVSTECNVVLPNGKSQLVNSGHYIFDCKL